MERMQRLTEGEEEESGQQPDDAAATAGAPTRDLAARVGRVEEQVEEVLGFLRTNETNVEQMLSLLRRGASVTASTFQPGSSFEQSRSTSHGRLSGSIVVDGPPSLLKPRGTALPTPIKLRLVPPNNPDRVRSPDEVRSGKIGPSLSGSSLRKNISAVGNVASKIKKMQNLTEKVGARAMGRFIEDVGAKEKQRVKVTLAYHPNIFDPTAPRRLAWDFVVILPLVVYLSFIMPFRICFANDAKRGSGVFWFEVTIELIFILDLVINFRTGYFIEEVLNGESVKSLTVEYEPVRVALHYAKTWLLLDLSSAIPFTLMDALFASSGGADSLKFIKTLRLLRFLKLARLFKVEDMLGSLGEEVKDRVEDFMQDGRTKSAVMLLSLMVKTAAINHFLACVWTAIGRAGSSDNMDNWLANEQKGPFFTEDTEEGPHVTTIYLASFYFCFTTMSSVGYGDITPRNNTERIFVVLLEFIGGFVFAVIIAAITSIVTHLDTNKRRATEQLDSVQSFIQTRKFPHEMGRRIRRHFRQYYEMKPAIDERKIFSEMSTALRMEVSAYIVSVQMSAVKIFQTMNPMLWASLLPLLKPLRFDIGETVCTQYAECSEMYIILNGELVGSSEVNGEDQARMREIGAGDSINVLSVLKVWARCVETVVVVGNRWVESYAVAAADFYELFEHDSAIDQMTFNRMREIEVENFKWDLQNPNDWNTYTKWGTPIYMTFSSVVVKIIGARGLLATDNTLLAALGTSDPYAVAELVDVATNEPINGQWRHRTLTKRRCLDPVWNESVRWRDVFVPFESLALRVRVFDDDTFSTDDPLGEVVLPLASLNRDTRRNKRQWKSVFKQTSKNTSFDPKGMAKLGEIIDHQKNSSQTFREEHDTLHEKAQTALTLNRSKSLRTNKRVAPEKVAGGGGTTEYDSDDPFDLSKHETWYDLKPCPGMEVPAQGLGAIRLRTYVKKSEGGVTTPTIDSVPESKRDSSSDDEGLGIDERCSPLPAKPAAAASGGWTGPAEAGL